MKSECVRSWRCRWDALLISVLAVSIALTAAVWADGATGAAQSAQQPPTTQPTTSPAGSKAGSSDDEARAAIRRLIEEKLKEKERAATTQPRRPVAKPDGAATITGARPSAQPQAASQPTGTQPATTQASGCGGDKSGPVDLTPPAPDQPQPKWACDQPTVDVGGVWKGKNVEYVFKIRNDGEGPLNIRLKGH